MSHIPKESVRCEFTFPSGRRCRQVRAKPGACYCSTHGTRQQQQEEADRIGDEIVGADGALNTQEGIHKALANVFCNLARNRISARNAAVLGYVGQLMLVSRPSIERTIQSLLPAMQLAIKIGHQNTQSQIKSDVALRKNALLELEILNGFMAQFEMFRAMSPEDMLRFMRFSAAAYSDKSVGVTGAPPSPAPQGTPAPKPQATPDAKASPAAPPADSK
ncbi:MAG: hypothetical protein HYR58_07395 [Acidobacteria bacterium]|nr:hypothetical protein [Acidobacteriota bacterium]